MEFTMLVYFILSFIIIVQPQCPVVGRRSQHAASTSAYLALSFVRWNLPVVVQFVSPMYRRFFFGLFLSYGFHVVIHSVHRLSRILLMCPAHVHFSYPDFCVSVPVCDVQHTPFHPSHNLWTLRGSTHADGNQHNRVVGAASNYSEPVQARVRTVDTYLQKAR